MKGVYFICTWKANRTLFTCT